MFNVLNETVPPLDFSEPMIIAGVILIFCSFLIPCTLWFIRNLYRTITRKDKHWFRLVLKCSWIFGLILFIIGLILVIVRVTQGG